MTSPTRRWLTAGLVGGVLFTGTAWTTGDRVAAHDTGSGFEDALGVDEADGQPGGGELSGWAFADARANDVHGRPQGPFGPLPPELSVNDADSWVVGAAGPGGVAAFHYQADGRGAGDLASYAVAMASTDMGMAFSVGATAELPHPAQAAGLDLLAAGGPGATWSPVAYGGPAAVTVAAGPRTRETTQRHFDPLDAHILADLGSADDGGADLLSALAAPEDPGALPGSTAAPLDVEAILVAGFAPGPGVQVPPGGAGQPPAATEVPEPASGALAGLGLGLCGLLRSLRRKGRAA